MISTETLLKLPVVFAHPAVGKFCAGIEPDFASYRPPPRAECVIFG